MTEALANKLREYASRYETPDFLVGDPSWFMHQVQGVNNQEMMAFMAAALSYGSRAQFLPKIQWLLDSAAGEPDAWVREGEYRGVLTPGDSSCYYRLYTKGLMFSFLEACRGMLGEWGSIGGYIQANSKDAFTAVEALCRYFSDRGLAVIIPKDATSACKRLCMFLRWMVRDGSPVDLGLWGNFIDKRTLIMPLDTHVLTEAGKLGLVSSRCASMSAAKRLTAVVAEVFPEDPLKGDFALFGYGVNP